MTKLKIWVDDVRPAPNESYVWCKTVNSVKRLLCDRHIITRYDITVIDLDHDAGDYVKEGGDYIKILDWLEETGRRYPIHIHSMNPVGIANMRAIIQRNHWKEV